MGCVCGKEEERIVRLEGFVRDGVDVAELVQPMGEAIGSADSLPH